MVNTLHGENVKMQCALPDHGKVGDIRNAKQQFEGNGKNEIFWQT